MIRNHELTYTTRFVLLGLLSRRFITIDLLDHAWAACKLAERDQTRSSLLGKLEPTAPETPIDDLSDEAITNRYLGTDARARQPRGTLE